MSGTRYCGVPAHQALIGQEPAEVPAAEVEGIATAEEAEVLEPVGEVEEERAETADSAPAADGVPETAPEAEAPADEPLAADRQEDETPA